MDPLLHFDVEARRRAVAPGGPYAGLADALARELEPLLALAPDTPLPIPMGKARMTRVGGRCPVHGVLLEFDPWSASSHRCARCGTVYTGQEHDDWWAMNAHLWSAERAVHAAALYLLRGDERHAELASRTLAVYAERYASWPNEDNVLGPSRPFFSTYLESIWLLNLCHALSLLEQADAPGVAAMGRMVRTRILRPSSALIAGFPERRSNRQVWHEVALLSALHLLGDEAGVAARLTAEWGLAWQLEFGLLADGMWYEGENYHLFAHRGLWYGIELLAARAARDGDDGSERLDDALLGRYHAGFVTPLLGLLPDDTLPSRRDSQYAVSVRSWRTAEWCELGYAATRDIRLAALLGRLYDGLGDARPASQPTATERAHPDALSASRARSTADTERNGPPVALTRASLSWRALLMADIDPPPTAAWSPGSSCLPQQGVAVLRRDAARTYVALEGGHTGGDHGHPDALALTLQQDAVRWLDDPGTGSYVGQSLHWYRSTLAHHAPLIDGASQRRAPATLLAFEDRGGAGWVRKRLVHRSPDVVLERTVVVCDGYLVDVLEWRGDASHEIVLPVAAGAQVAPRAADGEADGATRQWTPCAVPGAGGLEDGFDFATDTASTPVPQGSVVTWIDRRAVAWYASTVEATLIRATVPGPPGHEPVPRHWLRAVGASGRIVGVWAWPKPGQTSDGATAVTAVEFSLDAGALMTVRTADGTRAAHAPVEPTDPAADPASRGWHIELVAGAARSSIDLASRAASDDEPAESDPDEREDDGGGVGESDQDSEGPVAGAPVPGGIDFEVPWLDAASLDLPPGDVIDDALMLPLGAAHYVPTERSWTDVGEPVATVQVARTDDALIVDLDVPTGPVTVPPLGADNPLDNERPEVNADGVQWYVRHPDERDAWYDAGLVLPGPAGNSSAARATPLMPAARCQPSVSWRVTPEGWAMRLVWPLAALPLSDDGCVALDLVINERPPHRQRRRGQLVLSGGDGFGYLLGDRHEPKAAYVFALT